MKCFCKRFGSCCLAAIAFASCIALQAMKCFCKGFGSSTIASALRGHGLLSELLLLLAVFCFGFTLYVYVKELQALVESMDFLNSSNKYSSEFH